MSKHLWRQRWSALPRSSSRAIPRLSAHLPTRDEIALWLGFASYDDALQRLRLVGESRNIDRYEEVCATAARSAGRIELEALQQALRRDVDTLSAARGGDFKLEYFQYLILLHMEIYLHRYFSDAGAYAETIESNLELSIGDLGALSGNQVNIGRVAISAATGSGKTIISHVNLLQYWRYAALSKRDTSATLLITPNERMSRQHMREFQKSGIAARMFSRELQPELSFGRVVEILDINKLRRKSGEKTIDVSVFEGSNLVLIDEAHRGTSGAQWLEMREAVSDKGFSIEYSATFGPAVAAARKPELLRTYSRSIIAEYSYGRFWADGYGKDFSIINLPGVQSEARYRTYFLGALLVYLVQCDTYARYPEFVTKLNLAKPLLLLAGTSVNAVITEAGVATSDLLKYVKFLAWVVSADSVNDEIDRIVKGESGITDGRADVFAALVRPLRALGSSEIVRGRLAQLVFNATGVGQLRLRRNIANGEIAMSVDDNEPFGLITVGDDSRFIKLCEQADVAAAEDPFEENLFDTLDSPESTLSMVLGAKKFIEGWDTWRISAMGFANIGRSEGSEVIQLFGRGVRLLGINRALKRSTAYPQLMVPSEIAALERLAIFGLRADYLAAFDALLGEQDVPVTALVPQLLRLADWANAPVPVQERLPERAYPSALPIPSGFLRNPVRYSHHLTAQLVRSQSAQVEEIVEERSLGKAEIDLIDLRRTAYRLLSDLGGSVPLAAPLLISDLKLLLSDPHWYRLQLPKSIGQSKEATVWDEIAFQLLRRYFRSLEQRREIERFQGLISFIPAEVALAKDAEYIIAAPRAKKQLLNDITAEAAFPEDVILPENSLVLRGSILFRSPLLRQSDVVSIRPPGVNHNEAGFISAMEVAARENSALHGWEVVLLRNEANAKGLSYSTGDGLFFPDFIVWFRKGDRYRVLLVDPKGIGRIGNLLDGKVQFCKTLSSGAIDLPPNLEAMSAFILSNSPIASLEWARDIDKAEFLRNHIVFEEDGSSTYVSHMLSSVGFG